MKNFGSALEDCQQAATLQPTSPSPKTLVRLAQCQLVVDSPTSALSTLCSALSIEPSNESALQLQKEALELEANLRAEKFKTEGNVAFEATKFDDTINLYTKAFGMCLCSQIPRHRHRLALQKYGQIQFISWIAQHPTWLSIISDQL